MADGCIKLLQKDTNHLPILQADRQPICIASSDSRLECETCVSGVTAYAVDILVYGKIWAVKELAGIRNIDLMPTGAQAAECLLQTNATNAHGDVPSHRLKPALLDFLGRCSEVAVDLSSLTITRLVHAARWRDILAKPGTYAQTLLAGVQLVANRMALALGEDPATMTKRLDERRMASHLPNRMRLSWGDVIMWTSDTASKAAYLGLRSYCRNNGYDPDKPEELAEAIAVRNRFSSEYSRRAIRAILDGDDEAAKTRLRQSFSSHGRQAAVNNREKAAAALSSSNALFVVSPFTKAVMSASVAALSKNNIGKGWRKHDLDPRGIMKSKALTAKRLEKATELFLQNLPDINELVSCVHVDTSAIFGPLKMRLSAWNWKGHNESRHNHGYSFDGRLHTLAEVKPLMWLHQKLGDAGATTLQFLLMYYTDEQLLSELGLPGTDKLNVCWFVCTKVQRENMLVSNKQRRCYCWPATAFNGYTDLKCVHIVGRP